MATPYPQPIGRSTASATDAWWLVPSRRRRWLRAFGRNFLMLGVTGLILNRMHQGNWDHAPPIAMTVVVLILSLLFATMDEGGQVGVTWE